MNYQEGWALRVKADDALPSAWWLRVRIGDRNIVFVFAGSAEMTYVGQKVGLVRVRSDWMAVFQLAEWMSARVEGWVVAFPLAECRADDQKVGSVIHQFVRMRVDGHEDVYRFGWMNGH